MKMKRWLSATAAAVACALLLAIPAPAAFAAQPLPELTETPIESENWIGSLYLSEDYIYIEIGANESRATDYVYVAYSDSDYSYVTWSSNNSTVATVSQDGTITAWGEGTAIITATANTGAVGRCRVIVTKARATRLNTTYTSLDIEYNNRRPTTQLYLETAEPYDRVYQWYSSNTAVATVDRNGLVTGVSAGYAVIYAQTTMGNTLSCSVSVYNNIGRIVLSSSRLYLESIGGSTVLSKTVYLEDPNSVTVTWTSSNPAVATVDANGLVTAVGEGEAEITATTSGGRSDSCKVYTGAVATQKKQEAESFFGLGGILQDLFE